MHHIMQVSAIESFWRCIVVEMEMLGPMQAVGWFQRRRCLVPEAFSKGGCAAPKIEREKSCGSQTSQALGTYVLKYCHLYIRGQKPFQSYAAVTFEN